MSREIAFLFPGQGSQYVGMGRDFFAHFPSARDVFQEADDLLCMPLSRLVFEGPSEELRTTRYSQLAIYVVSTAILRTIQGQFPGLRPTVCAGLSLGEFTALTASQRLAFHETLSLVRVRAEAMQRASQQTRGIMHVVLGLTEAQVRMVLQQLPPSSQAWIANLNSPGQVVLSGTPEDMTRATSLLKQGGAKRVLPLEVSGAFHCPLMAEAQVELAPYIAGANLAEGVTEFVMNVPGGFVHSLDEVRRYLLDQVTQPVLWAKGICAMAQRGVALCIEIGCGKSLAGMNKRMESPIPTLSVERIEDLEQLEKLEGVYAVIEG